MPTTKLLPSLITTLLFSLPCCAKAATSVTFDVYDGTKKVVPCSKFLEDNLIMYAICRTPGVVSKKDSKDIYGHDVDDFSRIKGVKDVLKPILKSNINKGDWVGIYQFNSDGIIYPNNHPEDIAEAPEYDNSVQIFKDGSCIFRDEFHKKGKGMSCIPYAIKNKLIIFNGLKPITFKVRQFKQGEPDYKVVSGLEPGEILLDLTVPDSGMIKIYSGLFDFTHYEGWVNDIPYKR